MLHRIFCLGAIVLLAGCSKKDPSASTDSRFCEFNAAGKVTEGLQPVNEWLAALPEADPQNLQRLRHWLAAQPCVASAAILCESCIKTNPAQSELSFGLKQGDSVLNKVLDVSMGRPLRAIRVHE